jgi:hypothetical protein
MKEIGKKIEKKNQVGTSSNRPPVLEKKRSDGNFMQGIKLSV